MFEKIQQSRVHRN